MIKKSITYINYEGQQETKDYYFHLNKLDVLKMTAKLGKDLDKYVEDLLKKQDPMEMVEFIELLILTAVGTRNNPNQTFVRSEELRKEFEYSEAYAELFEEIFTNEKAASDFISALVSKQAVSKTNLVIDTVETESKTEDIAELEERLKRLRG